MTLLSTLRKSPSRLNPRAPQPRARLMVEPLETRDLPSVFIPSQIRQAYSFNQLPYTGVGQTIAIVDAYNDPNIASDLAWFSAVYGLPQANLQVVNQTGGNWLPAYNAGWSDEISADVEWAHAAAPRAKILLVEANSNWYSDLLAAVDYAAAHADVVSMSWGGAEFPAETGWWYDGRFTGHPGVTFVTSAGDLGAPPGWPGVSPNVISVGGTSLTTLADGTYVGETGWGHGIQSSTLGGSGGGVSLYEPKPAYQQWVWQTPTQRTNPDVSMVADPNTGLSVLNSTRWGWEIFGGTSLGAPLWAGIIALADEVRSLQGEAKLSSAQALTSIYSMPWWNFHDVTTGNNSYAAGPGYDLVTGRGTPIVDRVVNSLVAFNAGGAATAAAAVSTGTAAQVLPNLPVGSYSIVMPNVPLDRAAADPVSSASGSLVPALTSSGSVPRIENGDPKTSMPARTVLAPTPRLQPSATLSETFKSRIPDDRTGPSDESSTRTAQTSVIDPSWVDLNLSYSSGVG